MPNAFTDAECDALAKVFVEAAPLPLEEGQRAFSALVLFIARTHLDPLRAELDALRSVASDLAEAHIVPTDMEEGLMRCSWCGKESGGKNIGDKSWHNDGCLVTAVFPASESSWYAENLSLRTERDRLAAELAKEREAVAGPYTPPAKKGPTP